jgi:homoserine kinase
MLARVPASSANLGPGFDVLAIALSAYVEVEVTPADTFEITTSGIGAGRFDNEDHLAAQIVRRILGHSNFSLRVNSQIPLSRGLGSSAALAIAAALAAQAPDALALGNGVDGHAENAAASLVGGLVGVQVVDQQILVRSFPVDSSWRFVAAIPDEELSTEAARAALPAVVPYADAVSNLAALTMLLPGLADRSLFVPSSLDDRLHQDYRAKLLPFSSTLLNAMKEAGADGACWSGAGSTMLALAGEAEAELVSQAAAEFFQDRSIPGEVRILEIDSIGAVVR